VMGLKPEQFTLFDQGKPQRVLFFSERTSRPDSASSPAVANSYSNRPDEKTGASGGVTVILFDSMNTRPNDTLFARARVAKFLDSVRPEDRVALYALSTRLAVLHDFTDDSEALRRALDRFKSNDSYEARATKFVESHTGDPYMDAAINDNNQRVGDLYMGTRVQTTAAALEAIAHHLAGVPGRKNLVWVSGSFPIDVGFFQKRLPGASPQKETFRKEVEAAARALSNADVAIYPIAAEGVLPLDSFTVGQNMRRPTAAQLQTTKLAPDLAPTADWRTMDLLADITGGRVFRETNDIEGSIRRAMDDTRSTYVLGYYPDHDKWDGSFHEIKVHVAQPGVEIRHRRGYLASADVADRNRPPLQASDVIAQPLDSAELGLSMQIEPLTGAVRVHLRVDTDGMSFEQRDGRWTDTLEVMWVELGADGNPVASHGQSLHLRLSPENYRNAVRDGVRMSSVEAIGKQTVRLRFAARDQGSGSIGSLTIPIPKVLE